MCALGPRCGQAARGPPSAAALRRRTGGLTSLGADGAGKWPYTNNDTVGEVTSIAFRALMPPVPQRLIVASWLEAFPLAMPLPAPC
jgi:hypothetical protein